MSQLTLPGVGFAPRSDELFAAFKLCQGRIDVVPKMLERGSLLVGDLGQLLLITDAGEVGVTLPRFQVLGDERLQLR